MLKSPIREAADVRFVEIKGNLKRLEKEVYKDRTRKCWSSSTRTGELTIQTRSTRNLQAAHMNKISKYVIYGGGGVLAGLILGFLFANWMRAGITANAPVAVDAEQRAASVNSGRRDDLPEGHPNVGTPGSPGSGELPPNHPNISDSPTAASPEVELPSLDPLPAGSKELRMEQKYKNIQTLKGIPEGRMDDIMFAFRAALSVDCTHCHTGDQYEKDDKPAKKVTREMIQMTRELNAKQAPGMERITCFTCHRGQLKPPS